jgi:predicted tellurium resistance membrane protein TerC
MNSFQRKTIAVFVFLVAAFLGAGTQSDLYGHIHPILTFLIVAVSFLFMWLAIDIWKGAKKDEKKGDDTENSLMS